MSKKVLILTGSYGSWHNSAAFELQNAYGAKWDTTSVVDLAEYYKRSIGKTTKKFYEISSSDFPKIWEFTYDVLDNIKIKEAFYGIRYPYFQTKFNKLIKKENPDIVIIVFPFWCLFLKNYIKEYEVTFKTWVFITDAIHIHSVWYMWGFGVDYYFFIDDITKKLFVEKFHHDKNNLITTFFPLHQKYFYNRREIWSHHILLILTSLSFSFVKNILLLLQDTNRKVTIIQWRNESLFKKIQEEFWTKNNFSFFSFLDLKSYYPQVDICISKPGWATICECIATDIPLIMPDFIPGQEEGNKKLIEENEIGIYENDPEKILFLLNYIDWSKMLANFKKIKNPHACEDIIKYLS